MKGSEPKMEKKVRFGFIYLLSSKGFGSTGARQSPLRRVLRRPRHRQVASAQTSCRDAASVEVGG